MSESEIETLARWWNTFNDWDWPHDLPGKPDGFEQFPNIIRLGEPFQPNKYDWTGSIMRRIEKLVPLKELLLWHHLHNLSSSREEFEAWWKENHED